MPSCINIHGQDVIAYLYIDNSARMPPFCPHDYPAANRLILSALFKFLIVSVLRMSEPWKACSGRAEKPFLWCGKASFTHQKALSRAVIMPFPYTRRARFMASLSIFHVPERRRLLSVTAFTGFRHSLLRFHIVKIFYFHMCIFMQCGRVFRFVSSLTMLFPDTASLS